MSESKTAADQFDAFIKTEWQDVFRTEVHVKLDNGSRYVPNGGAQGVQLLRKNVNAFDAALRLWGGPTDEPPRTTPGYDRIVDQAGIRYTWEWFLIEPTRPWASGVPDLVRERIEADLARREIEATARNKTRAEEHGRMTRAEDDAVIARMNDRRAEQGKPPLDEQQEASVRENRRKSHTPV